MHPKISVIIPIYNVEKHIRKCIHSLLNQTFNDFEVLLINDGSPDKSKDICEEFANIDSRIKIFNKKNGGVSSARNLGLSKAAGDYITFIDPDDWITNDCFEKAYKIIAINNLDLLQYSYKTINEHDLSIINVYNYHSPAKCSQEFIKDDNYLVSVWGNFIKSSIIKDFNIKFNEEMHLAEDQIFMMEVISHCSIIAQTNEIYYYYLLHNTSATHTSKEKDIIISAKYLLKFANLHPEFKPFIERSITAFYLLLIHIDYKSNSLDQIYKESNIKVSHLHEKKAKILRYISYLGMPLTRRVIHSYLQIKK